MWKLGAIDGVLFIKMDFNKLAKARWVVVANSLCITKGLQKWVRFDDFGVKGALSRTVVAHQVVDHELGVFCFTSAGLARHDHRLRLVKDLHVAVGLVRDRKAVRRKSTERLSLVRFDCSCVIKTFSICSNIAQLIARYFFAVQTRDFNVEYRVATFMFALTDLNL